jgi:hypothetical protein
MLSTSVFKSPAPLPVPVLLDFVVSVLLLVEGPELLLLEQATAEATIHTTITSLEKIMRFMLFFRKSIGLLHARADEQVSGHRIQGNGANGQQPALVKVAGRLQVAGRLPATVVGSHSAMGQHYRANSSAFAPAFASAPDKASCPAAFP